MQFPEHRRLYTLLEPQWRKQVYYVYMEANHLRHDRTRAVALFYIENSVQVGGLCPQFHMQPPYCYVYQAGAVTKLSS